MDVTLYGPLLPELGFDAESIVRAIRGAAPNEPITLRVNSEGGDFFGGLAIHAALEAHAGEVVAYVDGLAASIASTILMAADRIVMAPSAMLMIHEAHLATAGDQHDLRQKADVLGQATENMAKLYATHSKQPLAKIQKLMRAETWLTADDAVALGLADAIDAPLRMVAMATDFNRFDYAHIPEALRMEPKKTDPNLTLAAEATKAERERVASIMATFKPWAQHIDLRDECITAGVTPEAASARLLEAIGAAGNAQPLQGVPRVDYVRSNVTEDVVTAMQQQVQLRLGCRLTALHRSTRDLDRMSLVDMGRALLRRQNDAAASYQGDRLLGALLQPSSDFSKLIGTGFNRSLLDGYASEPNSADGWVNEIDVNDFRQFTRTRLSEYPDLQETPESGEVPQAAIGDMGETAKLLTYANRVALSRQAIINDDLNAFGDLGRAQGQAAMRKRLDLVWSLMLSTGPTMSDTVALFNAATHGNYTSSGTAISVTSLAVGRAQMRKQKGPLGSTLNLQPRYFLTSAAKETLAEQTTASLIDLASSGGGANPAYVRGLIVRADARLDNAASAEPNSWFLAADPTQAPSIELAYLNGQRAPTNEEFSESGFLGLTWRVLFDVAAYAVDWRSIYKNNGA